MTRADIKAELFYLQDSRSYVGNDVLWWRVGGKGYTTDLREAAVYVQDEAQRMHDSRPSDIPWPKAYIDGKVRPAVDMQYIKRDEALAGTGIELRKPEKTPAQERLRCHSCNRFLSELHMWSGPCPNCGTDNRP